MFSFSIEKKLTGKLGRAGKLTTPHGSLETPAFIAVGTKATVKGLTPLQLKEIGVEVVLGNTYHLYLEPGEKIVEQGGGLGRFMGWDGPTMTDSGGFQVFSLGTGFGRNVSKVQKRSVIPAKAGIPVSHGLDSRLRGNDNGEVPLAKVDEDGVTFKSPKDGSMHRFTPERSIEIQHAIGADMIFAFDECTASDAPLSYHKQAMARTHRWAARSLKKHKELQAPPFPSPLLRGGIEGGGQALFGIIQGGQYEDLRKESAHTIGKMEFDGFGIGGSFDKHDIDTAVGWVNKILPEEKPRHLLGIGEPIDLFGAVESGCDLFDCVSPTRQARNGALYTKNGRINVLNTKYKTDFSPIEANCGCYTCLPKESGGAGFTTAYLSHLFRSDEILANTLATIHNVYFIVHLVKKMRASIFDDNFAELKETFLRKYKK